MKNPETLVTGEIEISEDHGELLYRQITEPLMDAGQPSSLAFAPQASDDRKPSFSRGSKTTPQASRDWHTTNAKKPSLGVWACSVGDVILADSRSVDDFDVVRPPGAVVAPGHCYVDYRNLDKREKKTLQSLLLAAALEKKELPTNNTETS